MPLIKWINADQISANQKNQRPSASLNPSPRTTIESDVGIEQPARPVF